MATVDDDPGDVNVNVVVAEPSSAAQEPPRNDVSSASSAAPADASRDGAVASQAPQNEQALAASVGATDDIIVHVEGDAPQAPPTSEPPSAPPLHLLPRRSIAHAAAAAIQELPAVAAGDYRAMATRAQAIARLDRLSGGTKSVFKATMKDIGALGIGLQLYFMLTKYLAVTFFIMGLISLPTIIVNYYGNGITSKMVDPLQLAYASLGNQGVNVEIANDPANCLPKGDIDCNWTTVDTPFASDPYKIAWIITVSDCLYSLVFLAMYLFYHYKAKKAIDEHLNENLTPAKYAVFVKGLPKDASEKEILMHFNSLYDLHKDEYASPLWFGCCWGKRRKVKHTLSRNAINRNTVQNLDHLAGASLVSKDLYLNTWIAEVSIGHPTGGLLRTFLAMEQLTQAICETKNLILQLEQEKKMSLATFKKKDEKLIHSQKKKLDKLCEQMEKKKSKIKSFKQASELIKKAEKAHEKKIKQELLAAKQQQQQNKSGKKKAQAKVSAAAHAARSAATAATKTSFNWEACECAFVVFNNLESRRRCLQDYRACTRWLPFKFQPQVLRFRNSQFRLQVTPAPEPSNILWENLETTERGRFYRRSLTNFVTFLLLLASAAIISGAQSAQQQFLQKMPPAGLCEKTLPQVFYGNNSFPKDLKWQLNWNSNITCPSNIGDKKPRYHISYTNGIVNPLYIKKPVQNPATVPVRCVDPCISESLEMECQTLPCFDQTLQDKGETCTTYQANHVLYCLCTDALTSHIKQFGLVEGAKKLWQNVTPCQGFITNYATKNAFIVGAALVVVLVNLILNMILRCFANFERHSSESAKATAIALKMFLAQFLNTAIIVLLVNTSLGLTKVPLVKELLKGKYHDFERNWYPSVGMGITTTMLINAVTPQLMLCLQMGLFGPLKRYFSKKSIRTQDQMNKLYAGPPFDISVRYPMVLNSLFVTMVFCGGSPILLFIASLTAFGTFWFDKLSILHLYSVKTAYDEELGELALVLLPWTLIAHLSFSVWMYGNQELMKSTTIDLPWLLNRIGMKELVKEYGNVNSEALYNAFLEKATQVDVLGKYGFVVKVVRSNVMLVFLFLVGAVLCVLVSMVWVQFVFPLLNKIWDLMVTTCCAGKRKPLAAALSASSDEAQGEPQRASRKASMTPPPPPVVLPEYTDFFRKSVKPSFQPDTELGFQKTKSAAQSELIRVWQDDHEIHGVAHQKGTQMRTWEAMQAPVKSYAIEMNDKYRLAVKEIVEASRLLRQASENLSRKTIPVPGEKADAAGKKAVDDAAAIAAGITATEPVSVGKQQQQKQSSSPPPVTEWKPRARKESCSSSSSDEDVKKRGHK